MLKEQRSFLCWGRVESSRTTNWTLWGKHFAFLSRCLQRQKVWVYRIKQSKFCVSFPYRSEMTQHDTSTEIFWPCSQLSTRFTIVWPQELYDKICQTLHTWLPLSSGFGSGKWSPRRVPRETREVSVAFEVFRDRCAEGDSSMHLLARSRDLWLSEISALNAIKFLSRLSQGLQRRCGNDSLLWKELP